MAEWTNTMPTTALVSVVIPVYRSEKIVPRLCDELRTALAGLAYEIVLVDDCSPDGSWQAIEQEAERSKEVKAVRLRVNGGQDCAIMAGLSFATGQYVVIMDDDLQHAPADIPRLLDSIRGGADVVYANFGRRHHTRLKRLMSWGAGKVAETVLRKPARIYLSPFKIMSREIVSEIVRYSGPFPYVDGLIFQVTSHIDQIDVHHRERYDGQSTHNFWKQAALFLTLCVSFSLLPLRLATLAGAACSAVSLLLGAYFLGIYFVRGAMVTGWTALGLINLFIGGVLMLCLGVIGEYVGRILMNANRAPQFVVSRTRNLPPAADRSPLPDPEANP
jgi:undecaprenyl-phosphate 4-deoxy-4-formamido-L-arabinose transferase